MTAAKVMDVISRLPVCARQAEDAVSAYTMVEMGDASTLLKIPMSECPDIWIRLPKHKWPKSWTSFEDPVVPSERNLYGHPLARLLWERHFEKILLKHGWGLFLGLLIGQPRKRAILICACGRYQNGWHNRKHGTDFENSDERCWSGRTNLILRPHIWVVLKESVQ